MIVIDTSAELAVITDPTLSPILERFIDLMDLATLYIAEADDTLTSIEKARGMPCDYWEYIERHPGDWLEAVFIISDEGAGHIVLVPDRPWMDAELLAVFRENASKPDGVVEF